MSAGAPWPAVARLGDRLREARLNARLTVREAAALAGLSSHGTLVQYEHGRVLPPLERLAALAQAYRTPLSSLLVSDDALAPVVAMLEGASAAQVGALAQLLQRALAEGDERR